MMQYLLYISHCNDEHDNYKDINLKEDNIFVKNPRR